MPDLIEEFVLATKDLPSPERFRRWAFIGAISAVLNRNVWTVIRQGLTLWPNVYILLVAEAAVGKGVALDAAASVLRTQPEVDIGPDSITHEALVSHMSKHMQLIEDSAIPKQKATMALFLEEWGTFMREPRNDTLAMLAALYDSKRFTAETIGRGVDAVENPYLTIVAGCTPAWFAEGYRPNDYEQGLPTRFLNIFHDAIPIQETSAFVSIDTGGENMLDVSSKFRVQFDTLSKLRGFVPFSDEAIEFFNKLRLEGMEPAPSDPMLSGYCKRRYLHLGKISLIVALARHPENMTIELPDIERAWELMLEAEPFMPRALVSAGGNVYQSRIEEVARFVETEYARTKRPVPEWIVGRRLGRGVATHLVGGMLNSMIAQQIIRVLEGTKAPERRLMPGAKVK